MDILGFDGNDGRLRVLLVTTIPETQHTTVLENKTKRGRKRMKKENVQSAESTTYLHANGRKGLLFAITLTRPFRFLFSEPVTLFSAIHNGFQYGLVYLFNKAIPLVFGAPKGHPFNTGEQGFAFLGMAIGPLIALC